MPEEKAAIEPPTAIMPPEEVGPAGEIDDIGDFEYGGFLGEPTEYMPLGITPDGFMEPSVKLRDVIYALPEQDPKSKIASEPELTEIESLAYRIASQSSPGAMSDYKPPKYVRFWLGKEQTLTVKFHVSPSHFKRASFSVRWKLTPPAGLTYEQLPEAIRKSIDAKAGNGKCWPRRRV